MQPQDLKENETPQSDGDEGKRIVGRGAARLHTFGFSARLPLPRLWRLAGCGGDR